MRDGAGEESARLRRYESVVFTVPDLDWHLDLVEWHIPGPGFKHVVMRHTLPSLPEGFGQTSAKGLSELLVFQYRSIGWSELVEHRQE